MKLLAYFVTFVLLSNASFGKSKTNSLTDTLADPIDYFKIPEPIVFDSINYHLAWSSHPTPQLYTQEFVPGNDTISHYKKMMLVQLLTDTKKIEDVLSVETNLLKERQKSDDIVNYQLINNADKTSYILDFVLSGKTAGQEFIEWNAYRYEYLVDSKGKKEVILIGISRREYNNSISFLERLAQIRKVELVSLIHYKAPSIISPD